jgi:hypothetical protein
MSTILFLVLIASFAVIGFVQWLRSLYDTIQAKKHWIWPSITGLVSVAIGLSAAIIWPILEMQSISVKLGLMLWPLVSLLTIATIQLGYDIVIKTFLKLIEGLGNLVDSVSKKEVGE